MNHQLEELNCLLTTGSANRAGDEVPDMRQVPDNPVDSFLQRVADEQAGVPANLADSLTKTATTRERLANRLGISGPYGSAAALAKENDGGELSKRAAPSLDFSDIIADGKIWAAREKKEWGVDDVSLES